MPEPRRTANRHPHLTEHLRQIIAAYAMRGPHREVVTCQPRAVELCFYPSPGNPRWVGNNGKVCFESDMHAGLAAEQINNLPGADRVQHYRCPRGDHFHHVAASRAQRTAAGIIRQIADAARRAGGR